MNWKQIINKHIWKILNGLIAEMFVCQFQKETSDEIRQSERSEKSADHNQ